MSSKDRSHSSSELVIVSVMRMKVMVPATMPVVPVGSRCGTTEPTVRLRPLPERGYFPAAQRMAGAAVAGARAARVGGSGSSDKFDGLSAHRHSLAAKSTILTRRQSQHFATMTRIGFFLGWIRGWRAQPAPVTLDA